MAKATVVSWIAVPVADRTPLMTTVKRAPGCKGRSALMKTSKPSSEGDTLARTAPEGPIKVTLSARTLCASSG